MSEKAGSVAREKFVLANAQATRAQNDMSAAFRELEKASLDRAGALAETWRPIETAPAELKDGRPLILACRNDTEGWPGYWESTPNYWSEVGWQEEDARQGHYIHRHPCKPELYMEFPPPPKESEG